MNPGNYQGKYLYRRSRIFGQTRPSFAGEEQRYTHGSFTPDPPWDIPSYARDPLLDGFGDGGSFRPDPPWAIPAYARDPALQFNDRYSGGGYGGFGGGFGSITYQGTKITCDPARFIDLMIAKANATLQIGNVHLSDIFIVGPMLLKALGSTLKKITSVALEAIMQASQQGGYVFRAVVHNYVSLPVAAAFASIPGGPKDAAEDITTSLTGPLLSMTQGFLQECHASVTPTSATAFIPHTMTPYPTNAAIMEATLPSGMTAGEMALKAGLVGLTPAALAAKRAAELAARNKTAVTGGSAAVPLMIAAAAAAFLLLK